MKNPKPKPLARRERQIMDVLYKLERATVGQVLAALPDQLNYSTVRAQLRVLEEKGHLRHEEHGLRYVYFPAIPRDVARRSALRHLLFLSPALQRKPSSSSRPGSSHSFSATGPLHFATMSGQRSFLVRSHFLSLLFFFPHGIRLRSVVQPLHFGTQ